MIKATINKVEVEVPEGTTILEAARTGELHHPDPRVTIPILSRKAHAAFAWWRSKAFPP